MPKGPQGQKRPADAIGNAVRVMQIATGEIQDNPLEPGKEYARKGGLIGGRKRAAKLSKQKRVAIAEKAAEARWSLTPSKPESIGHSAFTVSKSRKTRVRTPKSRSQKS